MVVAPLSTRIKSILMIPMTEIGRGGGGGEGRGEGTVEGGGEGRKGEGYKGMKTPLKEDKRASEDSKNADGKKTQKDGKKLSFKKRL